MSITTNGRHEMKLEPKLNLTPPVIDSSNRLSPITVSPAKSCVSLEQVEDDQTAYSSSPEKRSMMLAGCPRCLMYVMFAEEYPKCPKCKSTVLLDVVFDKPVKRIRS